MEEKDVIKKLTEARLEGADLKASKAYAKAKIMSVYSRHSKHFIRPVYRYMTALAAVAVISMMTFFVVDNMDDGDKFNRNGGIWSTYSDRLENGDSVIWPPEHAESQKGFTMSAPGYGGKGYAVRITGRTGVKMGHNYNYMGVVVRFDADSMCPECRGVDIKKYSGIMFKIKGDLKQGRLSFILPHESEECIRERMTCKSLTGYADYEYDITNMVAGQWKTVVIDFRKDLKQPFWVKEEHRFEIDDVLSSVHLFKWQYKNGNGELMDVWIDDLELY